MYHAEQMYPEYIITLDVPLPTVDDHGLVRTPVAKRQRKTQPAKTIPMVPSHIKIDVKVLAESEDGLSEVHFNMKLSTPLLKLVTAWCQHHDVALEQARFCFGDRVLQPDENSLSLGWSPTLGTIIIHVAPV
eukprot:gnl/MRDRNA2_/MRDRNA2_4687_c0_seq1.p1 gnl/MRDRNA2_/MRDRNA2_4687_c0~~gnl/MRDRNA2_/MRDRNA2_4687_c0_seq1.p1  ORF type:complete len:132 (+),score=16.31 gnl/MRDRNA2_/MRDRNA2_4687_c0_seq1:272-667(+)